MSANFIPYEGETILTINTFSFTQNSMYFDEEDYKSDLSSAIKEFVNKLL